jgi:SdrD B-like protein
MSVWRAPRRSPIARPMGRIGVCCVVLLGPTVVRGQANAGRPPERVASRVAVKDARSGPGPGDRETSAIVVPNAEPRSFRVVTVAVPSELEGGARVRYDVIPTGQGTILGSRTGVLDGHSTSTGVVLTVGVPAAALGGRTRVAVVRFAVADRAPVGVPIELDVAATSRIDVIPRRPMRGAQRGDRIELSFAIRNGGNVRDTIDLSVEAPASWSTRFADAPRIVLQPGEWAERTILAIVPTTSDLGDFGVALVATARGGARARGITMVEVTDGLRPGSQVGPIITAGVGSAASTSGGARAVESIALEGPLSDGLTVAGRITAPLPSDPVASRALTTLGYSPRTSFLSLGAPGWSATVGNTGVALSDLGGQTVFGRGGSLRFGVGPGSVHLLAATPTAGSASSWNESSLIGASIDGRVATGTLTAFLAHLRDSSYTVRALDAAGLGMELRPWSDGMLSGQLAARSYRGGSGLGAAGVLRTPLAGGQLDLQLTHAPGGTSAFALASDALTAAADRSFGRLHTEATYWTTRDQSAAFDDLSSTGWSLSPAYPILPTLTIGSYVQGSTFASSGADGRFASSQRDVGARGAVLRGGFELSADSRLSTISRAVDGTSHVVVDDDSRRVTNRIRLDHTDARGEIGIGGSVETNVIGAATMPSQATLDAHVDRLQLFPRLPHFTLSGSAQRLRFGDATLATSRLEADLELYRSTRIALGIERGTARDAAGVLQTVLTLKVERAARLPALGARTMTGVVFEDRNGNGIRDQGEPGVSGIVVRKGSQSVVTDAGGVFRVDQQATGRTEIDSRSLPTGWLSAARSLATAADEHSLGVIPTTAVDVDVRLAGGSDGTMRSVRVGRASLALRDSTGRVWLARTDAKSHATFDALPFGRYTLGAQFDESSEPIVVDPVPTIEITGAARRQHVTVTVRTRPVRMFTGQP